MHNGFSFSSSSDLNLIGTSLSISSTLDTLLRFRALADAHTENACIILLSILVSEHRSSAGSFGGRLTALNRSRLSLLRASGKHLRWLGNME